MKLDSFNIPEWFQILNVRAYALVAKSHDDDSIYLFLPVQRMRYSSLCDILMIVLTFTGWL